MTTRRNLPKIRKANAGKEGIYLDISDVTVVVVGGVGDGLDPAVGKVNGVGAGHDLDIHIVV